MASTRGCELARKYADFIKSMLKISSDTQRELGTIFCREDGREELGYTSIGDETSVKIPSCPPNAESLGTLHTHVDLDFFSSVDYLTFAAKDDEFSCIAYVGEDGSPYVKCIHRPDNVEEWLEKMDELQKLELEAETAYRLYENALEEVVSAIEEEGGIETRPQIVKELRKRLKDAEEKIRKLREKAIELEPNACVVKL